MSETCPITKAERLAILAEHRTLADHGDNCPELDDCEVCYEYNERLEAYWDCLVDATPRLLAALDLAERALEEVVEKAGDYEEPALSSLIGCKAIAQEALDKLRGEGG